MAKFTFLEVHLDGSEFTANAPFRGGRDATDDDPDVEVGSVGDESSPGGKRWLAALVGLLFLVVVAAVVKKKVGGGADPVPELADRE